MEAEDGTPPLSGRVRLGVRRSLVDNDTTCLRERD